MAPVAALAPVFLAAVEGNTTAAGARLRGARTQSVGASWVDCTTHAPESCLAQDTCHWFQGHCGGHRSHYEFHTCHCTQHDGSGAEMWINKAHTCDCGRKECSANRALQHNFMYEKVHTFGPPERRFSTGAPMQHLHFCRYDCKLVQGCGDSECNDFCELYSSQKYQHGLGGACFGKKDFMNGMWPLCRMMKRSFMCAGCRPENQAEGADCPHTCGSFWNCGDGKC